MRIPITIATGLAVAFSLASVSHGIDRKQLSAAGLQELRQEAPDFSLITGNQTISLKDYTGRVVILHFWATWCKPCKEEFPLFEKMYQRFKDKDVVFLPITIDAKASQEEVNVFARGLGASFPVYLARSGSVTDRYWTWGVPVTYFIDKKGWIVGRAVGPRNWGSPEVINLIEGLLAE